MHTSSCITQGTTASRPNAKPSEAHGNNIIVVEVVSCRVVLCCVVVVVVSGCSYGAMLDRHRTVGGRRGEWLPGHERPTGFRRVCLLVPSTTSSTFVLSAFAATASKSYPRLLRRDVSQLAGSAGQSQQHNLKTITVAVTATATVVVVSLEQASSHHVYQHKRLP